MASDERKELSEVDYLALKLIYEETLLEVKSLRASLSAREAEVKALKAAGDAMAVRADNVAVCAGHRDCPCRKGLILKADEWRAAVSATERKEP